MERKAEWKAERRGKQTIIYCMYYKLDKSVGIAISYGSLEYCSQDYQY